MMNNQKMKYSTAPLKNTRVGRRVKKSRRCERNCFIQVLYAQLLELADGACLHYSLQSDLTFFFLLRLRCRRVLLEQLPPAPTTVAPPRDDGGCFQAALGLDAALPAVLSLLSTVGLPTGGRQNTCNRRSDDDTTTVTMIRRH